MRGSRAEGRRYAAVPMDVPWLPTAATIPVDGRGELFYRRHDHPAWTGPTLLLLHGWTADADSQFFNAYRALAERYSFVALDHRGHGRGSRLPFSLEDAADDAAALVSTLGLGPVITVGFSMGGPISLLLARRHPRLVAGLVVQATAMEWRATRRDRAKWWALGVLGVGMRSRWFPSLITAGLRHIGREYPAATAYEQWLQGEVRRNDPRGILEAGRALSRFDAREWTAQLGKPAAALRTTADRLVAPRKQRALADALGAEVRELDADHYCTITHPEDYAALTVELVGTVAQRLAAAPLSESA